MRDHADKEVPCLPPKALPADAPKHVRNAARYASMSAGGVLKFGLTDGVVVVIALWSLYVALKRPQPFDGLLVRGLATAVLAGSGTLMMSKLLRQRHWPTVRFWCLARGVCPSCGYDLSTVPADPAAGLRTCPECAAVWMISVQRGETGPINGVAGGRDA